MTALRIFTTIIAVLLAGGEIARWWGQPRMLPLALDEAVIACGMLWAAASGRAIGLTTAWGAFCGFTLSLLIPTLDHLLYGPPKDSAGFYAGVLSIMLVVGVGALLRALSLSRAMSRAP
jgi:hypothetical protein